MRSITVLIALVLATAVSANLVVNGDFAAGETGWSRFGAPWGNAANYSTAGGVGQLWLNTGEFNSYGWYQRVSVGAGQAVSMDLQWEGEAPEAIDSSDVHYLMTPHHALQLALRHEKRAADFFAELVETVANEEVRTMAKQLAEEEFEHVRLLEEWLKKVPKPDDDWSDDPDPPNTQE